jgi:hypothetical protein
VKVIEYHDNGCVKHVEFFPLPLLTVKPDGTVEFLSKNDEDDINPAIVAEIQKRADKILADDEYVPMDDGLLEVLRNVGLPLPLERRLEAADLIERQAAELKKCGGLAEWRRLMSALCEYELDYQKDKAKIAALTEECEQLRKALRELVDAVNAEVNEKGAGGYLLARLSDARALLSIGSEE